MVLVLLFAANVLAAGNGTIEGSIRLLRKDGSEKADRSGIVIFVADVVAPDKTARAEIRQRNETFVPRISAVPAGAVVSFPNDDSVQHNVFSHSAVREFDLGRYARGRGKTVAFPRAGVSEVFCNVHKDMVSYVVVAPSSLFAVTGTDGTFRIANVPAGHHQLTLWHRFARPPMRSAEVDVVEGQVVKFPYELTEQLDSESPHKNKFGIQYSTGYH